MYRSMKIASDHRPMTGSGSCILGVRTPLDIAPDDKANVSGGRGGMSVDASVEHIDIQFLPRRLHKSGHVAGAIGNNSLHIWLIGEGPFFDTAVTEALNLRLKPDDSEHGFVEPAIPMSLDNYQSSLAATRDDWRDTGL